MKPTLSIHQINSKNLNFPHKFIERFNIVTDNEEFSLDFSTSTFVKFTCTLEKFFSSDFIQFFKASGSSTNLLIKSRSPFSEMTGISLTIDSEGSMLLTLSRSLDLATGLDSSIQLVDSAVFDSSCRLLQFDLLKFKEKSKLLERIQKNSQAVLSRQEYSCEFVAVFTTSPSDKQSFIKSFSKALQGTCIAIDEALRPRITVNDKVKSFPWPVKEEFSLLKKDGNELIDLFNWIGYTNYPSNAQTNSDFNDESEYIQIASLIFISVEGFLLPFQPIRNQITILIDSSTRLVVSLKNCKATPPLFELNKQRIKHFNERKFDPTTATADQSSLILFKASPLQTLLSFQLNSTA